MNALIGIAFGFIVWIGHASIWLVALNVIYSRPIHKTILKYTRLVIGVIIWSFPLALIAYRHGNISKQFVLGFTSSVVVWTYLFTCAGVALVLVPAVTFERMRRLPPKELASVGRQVLDVAQYLGRKPIGDGKHRLLAKLPGNQIFQVEFSEWTLELPDLPAAWDGLTILQLSDLHFTGTQDREFYEVAFDRCMSIGTPDIVVVTGDIVDTDRHHRWILPLLSRVHWKEAAFAILGNHDYWYQPDRIRRRLARLGMNVIGNSWREVSIRGESLIVIGHEGPWFRPGPDLQACPKHGFRLCLSHTPDNIRWARQNRIRLMLSGHNHGGQIRLPLFGSLFVPSRYSRHYDCGMFEENPTILFVSRGLAGKEPLRYNCRPEIARFILKKA